MSDPGRRGIFGILRVKTAFGHKGRMYAVGDPAEGCLTECGDGFVFGFCNYEDPDSGDDEQFDSVDFDRSLGIDCVLSFAWDYAVTYTEDGTEKKRCYIKGDYADGIIREHDGGVFFFVKGQPLPLDLFMDDVSDLEYEGGVGYELGDLPRLLRSLG